MLMAQRGTHIAGGPVLFLLFWWGGYLESKVVRWVPAICPCLVASRKRTVKKGSNPFAARVAGQLGGSLYIHFPWGVADSCGEHLEAKTNQQMNKQPSGRCETKASEQRASLIHQKDLP